MTPTRFAPSPHPAGAAARSSVEAGSWTAVGHHRQRQPIAQAGISASGNGIRAWRAPNGARRATGSPTGPPSASLAPTGWSMAPEQGRGEAGSDDQWARRRAYLRHRRSGSGVFCRPLTRCRRCGRTCGTGRPIRAGCAASCGDAPAASRCRRRALALSTAGSTSWPARLAALLPEATGRIRTSASVVPTIASVRQWASGCRSNAGQTQDGRRVWLTSPATTAWRSSTHTDREVLSRRSLRRASGRTRG